MLDDVLNNLNTIMAHDRQDISLGQENNRALASLCEGASYNWMGGGYCSAGSSVMPPGRLGMIVAAVVVVLVHMRGR